jgi:hypothetical protein
MEMLELKVGEYTMSRRLRSQGCLENGVRTLLYVFPWCLLLLRGVDGPLISIT